MKKGITPKEAQPAKAKKVPKTKAALKKGKLAGGVVYEITQAGKGKIARAGDKAKVKYEGRLAATGKRFDKGSIRFHLGMGEVINGWDTGVVGMQVGESRTLLIPAKEAYGREGSPPVIPPNSALIFQVELLSC